MGGAFPVLVAHLRMFDGLSERRFDEGPRHGWRISRGPERIVESSTPKGMKTGHRQNRTFAARALPIDRATEMTGERHDESYGRGKENRMRRTLALTVGVGLMAALLALLVAGCSEGVSQDVGRGPVPDDVVALIDQWKQATASSIVDLYTPTGFHLYGTQRYTGEDIGFHLVNPSIGHEELTPLLLVADQPGRYVVIQGVENTVSGVRSPSSISWEIVVDAEGNLKIAQSAWFKITAGPSR